MRVDKTFRRKSYEQLSCDAATVDYVGAEHFLYASDISHWDNEFPGNLNHLRGHKELSDDAKEKILYKNAKQLFEI
jgi:predicted TIM-barrel fold metal-dependent hydrolase